MRIRPSAIILKEEKILVMKYNYGGNTVFALPGGNPDRSETLEKALVRELKEELNLEIEIVKLLLTGEVLLKETEKSTLHCVFLARIISGNPELNPEQTSALSFEWVSIAETANINMYPNIGHHISKLSAQSFSPENPYIGQIQQRWF